MDVNSVLASAIGDLTTQVTSAFTTAVPFVLLIGVGFASWKYVKRFLGKV